RALCQNKLFLSMAVYLSNLNFISSFFPVLEK
ncbi:MAG: hypothetical protein ACI86H_001307, partial [bacterium]